MYRNVDDEEEEAKSESSTEYSGLTKIIDFFSWIMMLITKG